MILLVRKGAGHTLRRGADAVEEGVPGPDSESTWDRLVLERGHGGLADEVLGYGADVYVEEPPQLRERVVRRLRETLGQGWPRSPREHAGQRARTRSPGC